jgi:triosephosphate isomerase (TIM)
MRKKIVAGNWKMNNTLQEGLALVFRIIDLLKEKPVPDVKVLVAPAFTSLHPICEFINREGYLHLAAQDCHQERSGAYTGEVSAEMLFDLGVKYVIVGHSERRQYSGETDAMVLAKAEAALAAGIRPIICCGETLDQRNNGKHFKAVKKQLTASLLKIDPSEIAHVVIAYEPVWAIGNGANATPEQAQEMHAFIRSLVKRKFKKEAANTISILYGGSCTSKNAKQIFAQPDIDGGLIGGASLKAEDFVAIVNSF